MELKEHQSNSFKIVIHNIINLKFKFCRIKQDDNMIQMSKNDEG